jgi:predicted acyltransferase
VFMAGISIVFSLGKTIRQEGRAAAVKRVVRRGILLFVIGLLYSGGLTNNWPDMRVMGVLNRIALCYFFAGLMFCFFGLRAMIAIAVATLIGYWAVLTFVPIRDIQLQKAALQKVADERQVPLDAQNLFYGTTNWVTAHYGHGFNLSDHTDFQYLPGRKYDTYFDPEGILSTFPAIVTCLLGVFAGLFLLNPSFNDQQKVICLLAAGLMLAALGWAWGAQFPVIKKIWTSSYVLVAGGYSAALLGVFYWIVDVCKWQAWCQPFVWMGMNSITIYLTQNMLGGFGKLSRRFAGGDIQDFFNNRLAGSGDLVVALVGLFLAFWLVRFLYRRKIFLRL